jgi:hypothetical protein
LSVAEDTSSPQIFDGTQIRCRVAQGEAAALENKKCEYTGDGNDDCDPWGQTGQPKPTTEVQWQCGDWKPESIDDVEPFNYLLVQWRSSGRITWTCYLSPAGPSESAEIYTTDPTVTGSPQNNGDKRTRTITIRVVDPDGRPIKGVKVFRNHVFNPGGEERPKIENKDYRTNAKGEAVVALSGKSVDLRLWVEKNNFTPLHAMWAKKFQADGDQIPAEFTFQLEHGTRIGGIIKNEQGEPIEGVKVEVLDMTANSPATLPSKPGKRPVRSRWLAEGEDVVTDARGRWKLGNVPSDKTLVKDHRRSGQLFPRILSQPKIALRLSHPDYAYDKEWGKLEREQGVTHELLRDQTATIVMKKRNPNRRDQ